MKKIINLLNHRCEDGAVVSINNETAKITFNEGELPEVKFKWEGNLKDFNCLKFTIKVVGFSSVTTIFHTENSRAICDIAREINHREFPNNCWKEVSWYFREQPGWITPPSPNPFDFDNALAFGLCVDGTKVTEECSVEIKDLYFSQDKRLDVKDKEEEERFKKFLSTHKAGTLTDKKVLLWANSEKTRSSSIESVIEEFETYKQYYADLNPVKGSEQGGIRPVLVIQNDTGNKHSPTTIVAAITSKEEKAKLPTHVEVGSCGVERKSLALLEQIRTIDKSRIIKYVGELDGATVKDVNEAISISLGLNRAGDKDGGRTR